MEFINKNNLRSIVAIGAGYIVYSYFYKLLMYFLYHWQTEFYFNYQFGESSAITAASIIIFTGLAGGLVAGALAPQSPFKHAVALVVFELLLVLSSFIYSRSDLSSVFSSRHAFLIIGTILGGWVMALWQKKRLWSQKFQQNKIIAFIFTRILIGEKRAIFWGWVVSLLIFININRLMILMFKLLDIPLSVRVLADVVTATIFFLITWSLSSFFAAIISGYLLKTRAKFIGLWANLINIAFVSKYFVASLIVIDRGHTTQISADLAIPDSIYLWVILLLVIIFGILGGYFGQWLRQRKSIV